MLDIPTSVSIHPSLEKYLEDYKNWISIWKVSIALALIKNSHKEIIYEASEPDEIDIWISQLLERDYPETACEFLNHLLLQNRRQINILLESKLPQLFQLLRRIRNGVSLFIDKVDEAFQRDIHRIHGDSSMSRGPRNASYWQYAQMALAEAAYSILIENQHIKIFYAMRSEALIDAPQLTDKYMQVRSYFTELIYSKDDLRHMFNLYVGNEDNYHLRYPQYKRTEPAYSFVGHSKIKHSYVKKGNKYEVETFFDYLYRHSLKRPRDIMDICYALYLSGLNNLSIKDLRHIVNQESQFILQSYLSEIEPFAFKFESPELDELFALINTNTFTLHYLKYICERFNRINGKIIWCNLDCEHCDGLHPFSSSLNIGLVGYLKDNNVVDEPPFQFFKNSGESILELSTHILPKSKLYFCHPMLTNRIENIRKDSSKTFTICKKVIIGDGNPIEPTIVRQIIGSEKTRIRLLENEKIFISSTCFDLHDERNAIKELLSECGYDIVMSEDPNFPMQAFSVNGHDHCIDELLKCKAVVYVIGSRFGGKYNGVKYLNYSQEIAKKDSALSPPSISLMEYYVAKRHNIPVYVFVIQDIYNERLSYKKNAESYNPAFVKENQVFHIIDLACRFEVGNWFKTYRDIHDLQEIVKIQFRYENYVQSNRLP